MKKNKCKGLGGGLPKEVDWNHLDKLKFCTNGVGAFSVATLCLYPLSVIKTRQMVEGTANPTPFFEVVRTVVRERGIRRGLYAGVRTILIGAIPIRMLYLSTLEYTKGNAREVCREMEVDEMYYGIADSVGGAMASLVSQTMGTPIDVIAQRQQVGGLRHANFNTWRRGRGGEEVMKTFRGYRNGVHAFREILKNEGIRGLYRGYTAGVATLVPSSAIWWGFYGTYSRVFWRAYGDIEGKDDSELDNFALGITAASGFCAGMSSGFITTPLDAVKTRFQVLSGRNEGGSSAGGDVTRERMTLRSVARDLYAKHGIRGYFRGVVPRMVSVSLWGTTMVSLFEGLKRSSAATTDDEA